VVAAAMYPACENNISSGIFSTQLSAADRL
jgi:hypothetical protein